MAKRKTADEVLAERNRRKVGTIATGTPTISYKQAKRAYGGNKTGTSLGAGAMTPQQETAEPVQMLVDPTGTDRREENAGSTLNDTSTGRKTADEVIRDRERAIRQGTYKNSISEKKEETLSGNRMTYQDFKKTAERSGITPKAVTTSEREAQMQEQIKEQRKLVRRLRIGRLTGPVTYENGVLRIDGYDPEAEKKKLAEMEREYNYRNVEDGVPETASQTENYRQYLENIKANIGEDEDPEKKESFISEQEKNMEALSKTDVARYVRDYQRYQASASAGNAESIGIVRDAENALKEMGYSKEDILSLKDTYTRIENANARVEMEEDVKDRVNGTYEYDSDLEKKLMDGPVRQSIGTIGASLASGAGIQEGLASAIAQAVTGEYVPVDTNSAYFYPGIYRDVARQEVSENIENSVPNKYVGEGLSMIYNAGMSTADTLASAAAGGQGYSLANMAAGAASGAMRDTFDRTGDTGKSMATAAAAGGIEYITEKVSLDNLWDIVKGSGKAAGRSTLTNLLVQSGIEGSEEAASDVANRIVDSLINGGKSEIQQNAQAYVANGMTEEEAKRQAEKDWWKQLGEDALVGTLSGAMGGGAGIAANTISSRAAGSEVQESGVMETVAKRAELYDSYPVQSALRTYETRPTKANAGRLYQAVAQFEYDNNIEPVSTEQGLPAVSQTNAEDSLPAEERTVNEPIIESQERLGTVRQAQKADNAMRQEAPEGESPATMMQRNPYIEQDVRGTKSPEDAIREIREARTPYQLVSNLRSVQENGTESEIREAREAFEVTSAKLMADRVIAPEELSMEQQQLTEAEAYEAGYENRQVEDYLLAYPEAQLAYNMGIQERRRTQNADNIPTQVNDLTAARDSSGKRITVRTIRDIENEPVAVTESGNVNLSDITFESPAVQTLYNNASTKGTTKAAQVYLEGYPSGMNVKSYEMYFNRFVNAGKLGASFENTVRRNGQLRNYIPEETLKKFYDLGAESGKSREQAAEKSVRRKGKGQVHDRRTDKTDDPFLKIYEKIAEKTGYDVVLMDEDMEGINGEFVRGAGQIIFNTDSDARYATIFHEAIGEFSEAWNTEEMKTFQDDLLEWYLSEYGEERTDELISRYQKLYRTVNPEESYREAANEMVNDALAGLFRTEDGIRDFADWLYGNKTQAEAKSVLQKLADFIRDLIAKVKSYLSEETLTEAARQTTDMRLEQAEELRRRILSIADQAAENYRKAAEEGEIKEDAGNRKYSLSKYGFKGYSERQIENWKNSKKIVLYEDEEQFQIFISEARKHKIPGKKIYFGMLPDRIADRIQSELGINVHDFNCSLKSYEIEKIFKDHGDEKAEGKRGQRAITERDLEKIPEIVARPERITESGTYMGKPAIRFYKEGITVTGVVSDKSMDLFVQTMYANKKRSLATAIDEQASINTPEATSGTASNNILPDSAENTTEKRKYSLKMDSEGRELTESQREYFRNSKAVDENGNLMVMYHGTPQGGFTVFKNDLQFFTPDKSYADVYQSPSASSRKSGKTASSPQTYEVYLNMEKPFDIRDEETRELFIEEYVKGGWALGINPYVEYQDTTETGLPSWEEADNIYEFLEENELLDEYDGILVDEGGIPGEDGEVNYRGIAYVTFHPNQVKNVTNENPTSKEDIRYSLSGIVETDELWDDNDAIQETLKQYSSILQDGAEVMHGREVDTDVIRRIARNIKKEYYSGINVDELASNLEKVFSYLQTQEKVNYRDMVRVMNEVAMPVIEQSQRVDPQQQAQYDSFRKKLRATKFRLSDQQKDEIAYYFGTYENFRRKNFGTLMISEKATSTLDSIWSELVEASGGFLQMDTPYVEQAVALSEALDVMKPQVQNTFGGDNQGAAMDLALRIYEEYFKSQSDARAKKLNQKMVHERVEYHKKVREQYYEKLREERRKMKEKTGTINARIAEMRAARAQSELEQKKRQKTSEYRNSIKRNAGDLIRWIEKPTNQKHVPDALKKTTLQFLSAIDFISSRALEESQSTLSWREKMLMVQNELKAAEEAESSDEYGSFLVELDPDFAPALSEFIRKNQKAEKISDLDYEQLKELDTITKMLKRTITRANELHANKQFKHVGDAAGQTILELQKQKDKKDVRGAVKLADQLLNVDMLDSFSYFMMLGKGAVSIYNELREGFNQRTWHIKEAQDYMNEVNKNVSRKELKKWVGDQAEIHEFQVGSRVLKLSTGQIMSLYCLGQRNQARQHIFSGGVLADPVGRGKNRISQVKPVHITKGIYDEIIGILTPEQKAYADKVQQFLAKNCADWGNNTSMILYGYKKFNDDRYFPIRTSDNSHRTNDKNAGDNVSLYEIRNQGMTKSVIPGAKNALVIGDIIDVFADHVVGMANYDSFAVPLTDAMKWYNYKNEGMVGEFLESDSVKEEIDRVKGSKAKDYFIRLLKDINGEASNATSTNISNKLLANYKGAAVGGNIRVAIQQPTAFLRASALMDPKDLISALAGKPQISKAKENSAIALWKSWGYYETNMGQSMKQVITGQSTIMDKIRDKSSILAALGDEVTWGYLWNACEREIRRTQSKLKVDSEEYLETVRRRFEEVIDQTQVVDTILHRTQFMRSKDTLIKIEASFMSEPQKSYNMLYRAALEPGQKKFVNKKFARTAVVYVMTGILTSLAAAVMDAWRDDDFSLKFGEKYWSAVKENIISNVNPLSAIPYVKDVLSYIEGFDVERTDISGITNMISAVQNIIKYVNDDSRKTTYGLVKSMAQAIGQVSGIPGYNIMREVESLIENIIKEPILTEQNSYTKLIENLLRYGEEGDMEKYKKTYQELLDRYEEKGEEEPETKAKASIRGEVKKRFKSGEYTEEEALSLLKEYGMTDDEAYWAMEEIKGGDDWGKYDDFYHALETGTNIEGTIERYVSHGVDEKKLASAITSEYKEEYLGYYYSDKSKASSLKSQIIDWYMALGESQEDAEEKVQGFVTTDIREKFMEGEYSESEARKYLKECGFSDNEVYWKLEQWNGGEDWSKYDDFYKALETGTDIKKIINDYESHGVEQKDLKSAITSNYKEQYLEYYHSNKTKAADLKSKLIGWYMALGDTREQAAKKIDKWPEQEAEKLEEEEDE